MNLLHKYFTKTPIKYRILGDSLLIFSSGITGAGMYFSNNMLQIAVFIGIAGKIITNFATDEQQK